MIQSDIISILQWWLVILLLGIGFLPLTVVLFKNFFDRGYIFSKLLGIVFVSYAVFLLGTLHILPFNQFFSYLIFFVLCLVSFKITLKTQKSLSILKEKLPIFIFEEFLFLGGLFFWAYIHSFSPDVHGLEKYMDFGFINSMLRTDYFPPKDMWFTPFPINYYYFGHLTTAVLTKLSGIPSNITFNLMLSTIFAFCFTETFSLGANLFNAIGKSGKFLSAKRIIAGLLSAFLVTFAGNLHVLYGFFKAYSNENPVPFWELKFLPFTFPNNYWYPNATRFIHNTIHEFPIYSWVVADLHGHVLDIPFVLLTIAVLLSLFMKKGLGNLKLEIGNLLLIGFLLAVMYMTNAWDGGIYLLLTGLVLLYFYWNHLSKFLTSITITGLSLAVFSMPYSYFFKPFASGIGVLCAPDILIKFEKIGPFLFEPNHCQHSNWWQLLILYGFFYFFVFSYLTFISRTKKLLKTDVFILFLIILSTILIIIPEFIYLKDIYPEHYRANTMFKLVFQAFIMLSISCGYIIFRIISSANWRIKISNLRILLLNSLFIILTSALLALVLTYPYLAIKSYYNDLKAYKNLDGTAYLKNLYPSDYEAIQWINKNVLNQPVILEAQGDSYTDYGRVSANTGLPTVLGWTVHEWLWRGSYDIPSPRISDIKTLYETTSLKVAKGLLGKYKVEYVFVGALEHEKYPTLSDAKFQNLGKIVYRNQNTLIYKISK